VLQLPNREEMQIGDYNSLYLNGFNKFNKNFNFVRLIQIRTTPTKDCDDYVKLANNTCLKTLHTTTYTKGSYSWEFVPNIDGRKIIGTLMDYDNSGFPVDFNVFNMKTFYTTLDDLKGSGFIDENTLAIITLVNFYNINHDLLLNVRVVHERVNNFFFPIVNYNIIDMDPTFDNYLIASIILSILTLLSMLNEWKKHIPDPVSKKDVEATGLNSLIRFYNRNFRKPNFFEIISKICFNL
jgi:hypothetical protein